MYTLFKIKNNVCMAESCGRETQNYDLIKVKTTYFVAFEGKLSSVCCTRYSAYSQYNSTFFLRFIYL